MSDRPGDQARFDPRFDPAFQPGYDGPADRAGADRISRQPAPVREFVATESHFGAEKTHQEAPVVPTDAEVAVEDGAEPATGVNPFLIALWAVSGVFILGGVGLLQWLPALELQQQSSSAPSYSYFVVQAAVIGAPIIMSLGLATATGLLFVYALRWKPRPSSPAE